ncbi:hypothetical protein [Nonomuraea pusilla]|uniref:Uncharacterized protein n=1 Tax=Nonomuraea pusilla TaxID=46177 RepID=A0A1H7X8D5_9ACTN|nr:hypothetical protein [Nonomuraea pusilla]SEM29933.1 hypothetical protein SAMN05660976_04790 [Nonomuraea pusilla]
MARFRCEVVVEALPRRWFEECVDALYERAGRLELDGDGWIRDIERHADVALVEGEHLTAGARYQWHVDRVGEDGEPQDRGGTTTEVVLRSWERHGPVSAEGETWLDDGGLATWTAHLHSPARAETVRAGGSYRGVERWQRLSWAARLDAGRWWTATEGRERLGRSWPSWAKGRGRLGWSWPSWAKGPGRLGRSANGRGRRRAEAFTAALRHPLGEGVLRLSPAAAPDGRWRVVVTLTVRGRGWARPVAAAALPAARRRLEDAFGKAVRRAVQEWDETVRELRGHDPREVDAWLAVLEARLRAENAELDRWIAGQDTTTAP